MDYVNKGFIFEVHPFSPFRLIVKLGKINHMQSW